MAMTMPASHIVPHSPSLEKLRTSIPRRQVPAEQDRTRTNGPFALKIFQEKGFFLLVGSVFD